MLAVNPLLCDSYLTHSSRRLPSILRSEGKYTKLPASHDDIWFNYLYGIEDVKRVTEPYTKTLFKLDAKTQNANAKGSPYHESNRMFRMFHLFPVGNIANAQENAVTTDYGQYVIFIRNSDWAEPIEN